LAGQQFGARGQTATTQLRIPVRITDTTFIPQAPPTIAVSRFRERLPQLPGLENLRVSMAAQGKTVVLRGAVVSEAQRELLIRLVLLEPEISSVQDELVVVAPPPTPPSQSTVPDSLPSVPAPPPPPVVQE
jgi:hypothetical protein